MATTRRKARNFTDAATHGTARLTIIDEEFARRYWPDEDAVGKRIRVAGVNNPPTEIVGVVRRVKMEGLKQDSDRVQSYYAFRQRPSNGMTVTIKTSGDPIALASPAREQV